MGEEKGECGALVYFRSISSVVCNVHILHWNFSSIPVQSSTKGNDMLVASEIHGIPGENSIQNVDVVRFMRTRVMYAYCV